jgi:hypothetical protein
MNNSVLAQLAALPEKSTAELKQLWRDLYDREPPPYNKPFLIKRLAYRIQELAYAGLSARAEANSGHKTVFRNASGARTITLCRRMRV